ncbi:MAG: PucR family transcriptional regulator [Actinobacteria bacterium]|nr:PucR family transcriptional regulator [Actinomycetota bacterium]
MATDQATDGALDADLTGNITVRDLSELPYLQATVLAGANGLDRSVTWAHVTDALDPWNWLDPGDLVLTSGLIVPPEAEAQATFIERLAEAGLSGIVVSEDERCPPLSKRMLEAADRLAFPVLMGGFGVAFAQYGRVVAAANQRSENGSLSQITRVHSEVMAGLLEQRSGPELLDGLSRVIRCSLHVVDPETWEPLVIGSDPPDQSWREAYHAELNKRSGKAPFIMHLIVGEETALTMPIPTERSACVIAFPETDPAPRLAVLQQVAAACALEIGRIDASVERDRRSGAALLNDALDGRLETSALDALLPARGLDGELSAFAVDGRTAAIDSLARGWVIHNIPFLLGAIGRISVGVIRSGDLAELSERTRIEGWRAGVSDSFSGSVGITDAIRQARWALETVSPDGTGLSMYGDGNPSFLPRTLAECEATVDRILGPLIAWDRERETDLVKTLQAYLECDRSPSQASKILFVHTQTVNYRLARIQELTGRSMHATGDVSELWFALRALSLSQASG